MNQVVSAALLLGLLPLVLAKLNSAETAVWLALNLVAGFGLLADVGLRPTITRRFAYVIQDRVRDGTGLPLDEVALSEAAATYATSRRVYAALSIASALLSLCFGYFLCANLMKDIADSAPLWAAIAVTALATGIYIYSFSLSSLIEGAGGIQSVLRSTAIAGGVRLLASVALVLGGGGVLALAVSGAVQQVVLIALLRRDALRLSAPSGVLARAKRLGFDLKEMRQLWPQTWRMALTMLASFFSYQAAAALAVRWLPPVDSAGLLLAMRLLQFASSFARAPMASAIARVSGLRASGAVLEVRGIFLRKLRLALAIQILAVAGLVFVAPTLFALIGTSAKLPATEFLILLGLWSVSDVHHNIHASCYFTTNQNRLLLPTMALAFVLIGGAWWAVRQGLWALVWVQVLVPLVSTHWMAVRLNLQSLDWTLFRYAAALRVPSLRS